MGARHQAREKALQILFQLDITGDDPATVLPQFKRVHRTGREVMDFTEDLVRGAWERGPELDRILEECSENWRVLRMAVVDRNILRLALFELLYRSDTPVAVVLDEAIEIAKRFGNADSGPFVNGVLDAVRKRLESGQIRPGGGSLPGNPARDD